MKVTFKRGRKIGDPNYSSTDVGLEITADCDDEVYYDQPEQFQKWFENHMQSADRLLEAEIARIYSTRQTQPQAAPEPSRELEHASATNGRSYGDRTIDESRHRDEPRTNGYHNGNGQSNGESKPRFDWQRNRQPDRRDDRGRERDDRRGGGGGKSYGPPRSGSQLFAWAKGKEEEGADGFLKALQSFCKREQLPWRFNDLNADEVRIVFEAGQRMLEDNGGY